MSAIKQTFLEEDRYIFRKVIEEFHLEGTFKGDYYNFFIFEDKGDKPPIFYHVISPFDVVTGKAPQRALVWSGGELLLDIDFTEHALMRTGAMDAILLDALGVTSLNGKRVLIFGSGKTALWSAKFLKTRYPELAAIDFSNNSGAPEPFTGELKEIGLVGTCIQAPQLSSYDLIICHTNSPAPVIPADANLKPNAIVTSYISSSAHGELEDAMFDSDKISLVIDWEPNLKNAKDVKRALESGKLRREEILTLRELLQGSSCLLTAGKPVVFRSAGTPIQNLAVIKTLQEK